MKRLCQPSEHIPNHFYLPIALMHRPPSAPEFPPPDPVAAASHANPIVPSTKSRNTNRATSGSPLQNSVIASSSNTAANLGSRWTLASTISEKSRNGISSFPYPDTFDELNQGKTRPLPHAFFLSDAQIPDAALTLDLTLD